LERADNFLGLKHNCLIRGQTLGIAIADSDDGQQNGQRARETNNDLGFS
jgi:hypothetical protein